MNKVCYTALFGNYEELKEPAVITPGWDYICFTDQPLNSDVWQIRKIDLFDSTPQKMARYFKIMEWVDWPQSMWIDASFIIKTDLNEWWAKYFDKGFSVPNHPTRNCVYEEIDACIGSNRGNSQELLQQRTRYANEGVKRGGGIITSGLLMRENKPEVIELCEAWYEELKSGSIRDQVAFAKISPEYKDYIHTYNYDYTLNINFRHVKHYNRR